MSDDSDAARMELDPDSLHGDDEGQYLDCPQCGSPAYIVEILQEGHCRGYQSDEEDSESVDRDVTCDATLSLELVWADEA